MNEKQNKIVNEVCKKVAYNEFSDCKTQSEKIAYIECAMCDALGLDFAETTTAKLKKAIMSINDGHDALSYKYFMNLFSKEFHFF